MLCSMFMSTIQMIVALFTVFQQKILSNWLIFFKSKGFSAVCYHGKLDFFEKAENAKLWLNGQTKIMCGTSAFGMGIDKPDVWFVIHNSISRSLEHYYQEAETAGRDGKPSTLIIMFRFADRNQLICTVLAN